MSQFKATGRSDGEQGSEDPPHPKATRQENFLLLGGGHPSVLFFLLIDEVHPPEEPSAYSKDSNVNLSKHTPAQEHSDRSALFFPHAGQKRAKEECHVTRARTSLHELY